MKIPRLSQEQPPLSGMAVNLFNLRIQKAAQEEGLGADEFFKLCQKLRPSVSHIADEAIRRQHWLLVLAFHFKLELDGVFNTYDVKRDEIELATIKSRKKTKRHVVWRHAKTSQLSGRTACGRDIKQASIMTAADIAVVNPHTREQCATCKKLTEAAQTAA